MLIDTAIAPLFLASAVSLMLTPGPAKLYLAGVSLGRGAPYGILVALGILASDLLHVTVSSLGVGVVLERHPLLFDALRIAGAAYLTWLAISAFREAVAPSDSTQRDAAGTDPNGKGGLHLFSSGLLINVLNPLAIVFYLSLLPQFVSREIPSPAAIQMLAAGTLMVTLFFVFHVAISLTGGTVHRRLRGGGRVFTRLRSAFVGSAFLALAIRVALQVVG